MSDWALITGASEGIGRELAHLFAADHFNLVLVARNQARLEELSAALKERYGIESIVLVKDLARSDSAREIFEALTATPVSVLVNNAGFGHFGNFADTDLKVSMDMMQVNMTSLAELTHRFVQPMIARKRGRVLNVASIAAFQPGPTVSVYYASKAFVYSFSYALALELEPCGITVTALCPGTTRTEFFDRANIHMRRPYPMMDAGKVAELGYRGMLKGKRVVIPGFVNRVLAALSPCMPSAVTAAAVRKIHAPQ